MRSNSLFGLLPTDVLVLLCSILSSTDIFSLRESCFFFATFFAGKGQLIFDSAYQEKHKLPLLWKLILSQAVAPTLSMNCSFVGDDVLGSRRLIDSYLSARPIWPLGQDIKFKSLTYHSTSLSIRLIAGFDTTLAQMTKEPRALLCNAQIVILTVSIYSDDILLRAQKWLRGINLQIFSRKQPTKLVLIDHNGASEKKLNSVNFATLTKALQTEFGGNLLCNQVNSRTGEGVKEALDNAIYQFLTVSYPIVQIKQLDLSEQSTTAPLSPT